MWGGDVFFSSQEDVATLRVDKEKKNASKINKERPPLVATATKPSLYEQAVDDDFLSDTVFEVDNSMDAPFASQFLHVSAALEYDPNNPMYSSEEHLMIQSLRSGVVWAHLMRLGEIYVEAERFNLEVGSKMRDKERKMRSVVELNSIYDEIRSCARRSTLSNKAEAFMFSRIQDELHDAMVALEEEQKELHDMQIKITMMNENILTSQKAFKLDRYIHQRDVPHSATRPIWDQFLKDICREDIFLKIIDYTNPNDMKILNSIHFSAHHAASIAVPDTPVLSKRIIRRRASVAVEMPQSFLSFITPFLRENEYIHCNSDILMSLLPQLMGRTVNAGIPYDLTRTILCHPNDEMLSPMRVTDPNAALLKLHLEIHSDKKVIWNARMMNFFQLFSSATGDVLYGVKIFTFCKIALNFDRINCSICDGRLANTCLSIRERIPIDDIKATKDHSCPLKAYETISSVFGDISSDKTACDKIALNVMRYVNPYSFVRMTRLYKISKIDLPPTPDEE